VTDSSDSKMPRRPRLRAHAISPLPAAALGLGMAASASAGTPPPVVANNDHFDVITRRMINPALGQTVGNVLQNDSPANSAFLVSVSAPSPASGAQAMRLLTDGTAIAQVFSACSVTDAFVTYRMGDGLTQASANAFFHFVAPVNPDLYTTPIDQAVVGNISDNDPYLGDARFNPLRFAAVAAPAHGDLSFNAIGTFSYVPDGTASGHDSFSYKILGTDTCNVIYNVGIDVLPVAVDDYYETAYLTAVTDNVLVNDLGDHNALSVVDFSAPAHGILSLQANGDFSYAPEANFVGFDDFAYTVQDADGFNASATVTIQVDNAPPLAVHDVYSVPAEHTLSDNILANDSDPNGDSINVLSHSSTVNGTLSLAASGTFDYTPFNGFSGHDQFHYTLLDSRGAKANALVDISVLPMATPDSYATPYLAPLMGQVLSNDVGMGLTASVLTSATHGILNLGSDGSFSYQPGAGFSGTDGFVYIVEDSSGQNASASVSIQVGNGSPSANPDSATTTAGQVASGNVLSNDSDPDGGTLSVSSNTTPAHGAASVQPGGAFTYTPNTGFSGSDTFAYMLSDGQGGNATSTVSIQVAPAATADSFNVVYAGTLTGNVLSNDLGGSLTAALQTQPQHGQLSLQSDGSFTYTPNAGFSGADSFTYLLHDGAGQNATATVSISVGNGTPAPVVDNATTTAGQSVSGNVLSNDSDPDGGTLSVSANTAPSHGTASVQPDGSFIYTPSAGFSGSDSFQYTETDGQGGNASSTVSVHVTPVATADIFSGPFGTNVAGNVLGNDVGSSLTAAVIAGPTHGTLALAANGSFTYTPNAGFSGSDSFTYAATDASAQNATASVSITIGNASPVAVQDTVGVIAGHVASGNVLTNDHDADGGTLSVSSNTAPAHGTAAVAGDGSFTYTPVAGFSGTDAFNYSISDGQGGNAAATVNVLVTPYAAADNFGVSYSNRTASGNVLGNDQGSGLSVALVTGPAHGSLVLNPDGSFTYIAASGFGGNDGFDYSVTDSSGSTTTAHVTLGVGAVPESVPALDGRGMGLLAGVLAWLGWRRRRRDA
jgi:VCBS repeat-containing protein